MQSVTVADMREHLADLLLRVANQQDRITISRHGKPLAVMVSCADARLLERLEMKIDSLLARAALEEIREKGEISLDEVMKELTPGMVTQHSKTH